ncbi:hypothetical protein C8Q77DRAFT_1143314 [Trametes polyzona]|nr:hypothetical protein C8Q77DRAFT_1143314 [Trametes polyzona]
MAAPLSLRKGRSSFASRSCDLHALCCSIQLRERVLSHRKKRLDLKSLSSTATALSLPTTSQCPLASSAPLSLQSPPEMQPTQATAFPQTPSLYNPTIQSPRPWRAFTTYEPIINGFDIDDKQVAQYAGQGNPSYWRVGGEQVQYLVADHREARWRYEWDLYYAGTTRNPATNVACPWPPFKAPPAAPTFAPPQPEAPEVAHPDAEAAQTVDEAVERGAAGDSDVAGPVSSDAPTAVEGPVDVTPRIDEAPQSEAPATPPGLEARDNTRLERIVAMLREKLRQQRERREDEYYWRCLGQRWGWDRGVVGGSQQGAFFGEFGGTSYARGFG